MVSHFSSALDRLNTNEKVCFYSTFSLAVTFSAVFRTGLMRVMDVGSGNHMAVMNETDLQSSGCACFSL